MKILIATDTYSPTINGVVTSVINLKEQLEMRGHNVRILTLSNHRDSRKDDNVYYVGSLPVKIYPNARMALNLFHPYIKEIINWRPDIIHTQSEFTTFFYAEHIARKCKVPIVHTYHTMYEDYTHYFTKNKKIGMKCVENVSKLLLSKVDSVIVPTRKVKKALLGYGVKSDIKIIPSGINLQNFNRDISPDDKNNLRDLLNINDRDIVFITVGRLGKEKNIQELIGHMVKLCSQRENIKFLIVGDGPYRQELEDSVKEYGLGKNIIFTGMIPPDRIANYYQLGHIFISASTSETQGLTTIEALASSLPLICKNDPCLEEVLREGKNGFTYDEEDVFIKYANSLIENPILRDRMGKDSKERATKYSVNHFAISVEDLYQEVIFDYQNYHHKKLILKKVGY